MTRSDAPTRPTAALAADALVVHDVTVRSVVVPFRRPLRTKVGDFSRWPLLLVDVTTEQGVTGRSYLAPYLPRAAAGRVGAPERVIDPPEPARTS